MIERRLKEIAELALIGAVPEIVKGMKPGRGKNLCDRLSMSVHKTLAVMPEIRKEDIDMIQAAIGEFGRITGWEGKERHMTTYLSFCADLIERSESKFDKCIMESLNDLVEYFEIGGNLRVQNCWSGALAADKWFSLFEGGKDGI